MSQFLPLLGRLLLLRCGPQDLPYSTTLLGGSIAASLVANILSLGIGTTAFTAIPQTLLATLVSIGFVIGLLQIRERTPRTVQTLTALFATEDRALEAKPFTDDVMGQIRAKGRMRKLLLAVSGIAGALLAASQLPKLLADTVGLDTSITTSIIQAQTNMTALASSNPLWLGIAAIVGLSLFAVAAMERA